jgi:hypothetical protein
MIRRLARIAVVVLVALAAPGARAGSPDSVPLSPEAAIAAQAVLASDDVGGGGWYNPASLAAVTRGSVQVGASAYAESATVLHDASQTKLPWGTQSGDIRSLRYSSVPSVLSYSFKLRDGLGISLGVWTPYHNYDGGSVILSSSGPYPGLPTPVPTTFSQSYAYTERRDDTWYGAGIGWQATPRLRLGAMLQGSYGTDVWTIDLNAVLKPTSGPFSGAHVSYSERGDQMVIGLRPMFGLQWDATEHVRIAAAMRGPYYRIGGWGPVDTFRSFAVDMPTPPPGSPPLPPNPQGLTATQTTPGGGDFTQVEPIRLYGGLRWAAGEWSVSGEVDWHPALDGEFGQFREGWNARAGATKLLNPDLKIGAGLFLDSGSEVGTATRSSMRYAGLTLGAVYRATAVVRAQKGANDWDLLTGIAGRLAYGWGTYRGIYLAPYDPSVAFPDVAADVFEGSISFFTAIVF